MYVDKKGNLRNSSEDLEALTAYCRERVKLMKNTDVFLELIDLQWDARFKRGPDK